MTPFKGQTAGLHLISCPLNIFITICSIVTNFDTVVSAREKSLGQVVKGQIASLDT